jgi:uncharacterized membrane protein YfcA
MEFLNNPEWISLLVYMFGLAALAGFLAGLLGIGGGLVLVPGLYFVFTSLGFESDTIMHVAVGTSLSTIIATGISSARAHHRRGAVRFDLVKNVGIGMLCGVVIGTFIAAQVTGLWLQVFFAVTLVVLAVLMRFDPEKIKLYDDVPAQPIPALAGTFNGTICTLMGIGGAALNVPYLTLNNVSIHRAIGTSSALGLFIAIPGTIGFLLIGLDDQSNLPPFTFGYINLLALSIIVPVTVLFAPLGVSMGHKLSIAKLRSVFSVFMIIIALRMLYEVYRAVT